MPDPDESALTTFMPGVLLRGGVLIAGEQEPATAELPNFPVPRRPRGLRLHGEYLGGGFKEPKYIARRRDGQVVQLSRLLYLVADAMDGKRDTEQIAHRVSGRAGRELDAEGVEFLIDTKLRPLGLVISPGDDETTVPQPRSDLLLTVKGRRNLLDARRTQAVARALAWLHRPAVVAAALAAFAATDIWLFAFHGAISPVLHVLDQPVYLIAVFGLTIASLLFHEFGHASACRYGGAQPGAIGCGLYLIWPSMFTDVTDVYRIGRKGRLRTDLGGVYFNVVFIVALAAAYVSTGQEFLLAAVVVAHFEIIEQLIPVVRLDGYYILGDLAGIPDLFGKIKPIVTSLLPGRPTPPEVADLKTSSRVLVTAWVAVTVPVLIGELTYCLWNLPRLLSTALRSLSRQVGGTYGAFAEGHPAAGMVGVIGSAMLVFPLAGMGYLSFLVLRRVARFASLATHGRAALRFVAVAAVMLALAAFGVAWLRGFTPKPLPPTPPAVPRLQPGVPTHVPPRPQPSAVPSPAGPETGGDHRSRRWSPPHHQAPRTEATVSSSMSASPDITASPAAKPHSTTNTPTTKPSPTQPTVSGSPLQSATSPGPSTSGTATPSPTDPPQTTPS
ncbi:hypothetical protein [Streptomyces sp. NPDC092307]|uniref:M50 family metallopeptidase n=1 Tax=Streptomyces sp. NPDC092307 TaxID=3366013 RepID=UPI0037F86A95